MEPKYVINYELLDNIHWEVNHIMGYNLPFNFIISEREAGKSTATWLWIFAKWIQRKSTVLVIRRKQVHITKAYIEDISRVINKFLKTPIRFHYATSSIKDGLVDVYIDDILFMRVIGLSVDITVVKSGMLPNLETIVFDEFICNKKFGEKYLKDETTKFLEVYNTFRRESHNLKCIFLGNPYSLYNPYFIHFNVDTKQLKRGTILSDKKSYLVECYELTPELREKILKENPLYQFDNSYTKYAFYGANINDENIWLENKRPENFSLYYIFGIDGKYLSVYVNNDYTNNSYRFYISSISKSEVSKKRNIYVFNLDDLIEGTMLLNKEDKYKFARLRNAMRMRAIAFETIECYYLFEEIYYNL